jgi:hypothetical protein
MTMDPPRVRRRPRTRASSVEFAFLAIAVVACLAATLTLPVGDADPTFRLLFRLALFVASFVVVALLALLFRGTRGDWHGFTVWCAKGLLAFAALFVVGHIRGIEQSESSSLLTALRSGQITIDRFVRAERAAAPGLFDQRLLRNNERALRESFPNGDFSDVSMVDVSDGSGWMRVHMRYRGIFAVQDGGSIRSNAEIVLYYHREGMAVITAACTADPSQCGPVEPLLAAAERSLRGRFDAPDLDGVLPAAAQCSVETISRPGTDHESRVRACLYRPGIQLTLTRFDAEATIASLLSERAATP